MIIFQRKSYSALMIFMGALLISAQLGCMMRKPSIKLDNESEEDEYVGIITNEFEKDGCPWLIVYNDGVEDKYLIPVQLDDAYKKNGLEVRFAFHYSRIMQQDCQMGQPVVLEDIEIK